MKFTIFRELLDYLSHIAKITDADMNYYPGAFKIVGESEGQVISIDVSINKKEENENGN